MAKVPLTPDAYIKALPPQRQEIMRKLRAVVNANLPKGFAECISYGAIGYVIPHSLYPAGYHCDPRLPLPLMMLASPKSHIALHHMGVYMSPELLAWLTKEWKAASDKKLDMGKGCIRFKQAEDIPLALIGKLVKRMTPAQFIEIYEGKLAQSKQAMPKAVKSAR